MDDEYGRPAPWHAAAARTARGPTAAQATPRWRQRWDPGGSQFDLHAIVGDLDAGGAELRALGPGLIEDRIGVVDVDQDAARTLGQACELLGHAAGAALRQVPQIAGTLVRHADADHLIVTPEGTVHQNAIAGVENPLDRRRDAGKPRAIKQLPSAAGVAKNQPDVVPDAGILAIRRVRPGLARHRQRGDCYPRQRRDLKFHTVHRNAMPVHAAEMLQYLQDRQTGAQVLAHRLGSPQLQRG